MSEAEFWLLIRRALLMICKAIEKRYNISEGTEVFIDFQPARSAARQSMQEPPY